MPKPARHWLDSLPDQLARATATLASASLRNATALAVVPDLIRKRYRKLRKCARRLTPESSMEEFHEVRIRAKKLRYALEVVAPTYAKPADRVIAKLQKLQSTLGTQHDADVLARYLEQLAGHPPADFTAATLFVMGRMAQLQRVGSRPLGPRRRQTLAQGTRPALEGSALADAERCARKRANGTSRSAPPNTLRAATENSFAPAVAEGSAPLVVMASVSAPVGAESPEPEPPATESSLAPQAHGHPGTRAGIEHGAAHPPPRHCLPAGCQTLA